MLIMRFPTIRSGKQKAEILITTPTRQRAERAREMIAAWQKCTTGRSEIVFYVDDDDSDLEQYQTMATDKIRIVVGRGIGMNASYNALFDINPDYDFYAPFDDDQHIRTPGWEDIAIAKLHENNDWGLVYGDDLFRHADIASAPVLSGKMMRCAGWIGLPGLEHMYCDDVWMDVARACDGLFYMPELVIEHMHFWNGKAPKDTTYEATNNEKVYSHDKRVYDRWKKKELPSLAAKLQTLMEKDKR